MGRWGSRTAFRVKFKVQVHPRRVQRNKVETIRATFFPLLFQAVPSVCDVGPKAPPGKRIGDLSCGVREPEDKQQACYSM